MHKILPIGANSDSFALDYSFSTLAKQGSAQNVACERKFNIIKHVMILMFEQPAISVMFDDARLTSAKCGVNYRAYRTYYQAFQQL